ncbi:hypothetical protein D9738_20965 [Escherichia sp. E10V5]|nr:hypothetical protein D9738_20965 [Escherichia sp. E10V5]
MLYHERLLHHRSAPSFFVSLQQHHQSERKNRITVPVADADDTGCTGQGISSVVLAVDLYVTLKALRIFYGVVIPYERNHTETVNHGPHL